MHQRRSENYSPLEFRRLVRDRASRHCNNCGTFYQRGHADHIVPLWRGGKNSLNNGQWLCLDCHTEKTCSETEYRKVLSKTYKRFNTMVTANDNFRDFMVAIHDTIGKFLGCSSKRQVLESQSAKETPPIKIVEQPTLDFSKQKDHDVLDHFYERIKRLTNKVIHWSSIKDTHINRKFGITKDELLDLLRSDPRFNVHPGKTVGSIRVTLQSER